MARYKTKQAFNISIDGTQIAIPAGEVLNTENRMGAKIVKQLGKDSEHLEDFTSFGQFDSVDEKGVESATSAPGEKRGTTRTTKK